MKGKRHSPEQIVRKLREADRLLAEGADVDAVCRHLDKAGTKGIPATKARVRLFCDDWEQASHAGELMQAVDAGLVRRDDVVQLGDVLVGTAAGRRDADDITIFDSTGLAIQDLAIALDALAKADELDLPMLDL